MATEDKHRCHLPEGVCKACIIAFALAETIWICQCSVWKFGSVPQVAMYDRKSDPQA